MKTPLHSTEDWFKILKWDNMPNLGLCNTITKYVNGL